MKHLKRFRSKEEYDDYKLSVNYIEPFVGKINNIKNPQYDKLEERVIATFVTTESNEDVKLYCDQGEGDISSEWSATRFFSYIQIENNEPIASDIFETTYMGHYEFENPGNHTVYFTLKDPERILRHTFSGSDMISVKIPSSVKMICEGAFEYDTKLEYVEIGNGVKFISCYAFDYCTNLTDLIMGDGCEYISSAAFANDLNLKNIRLSKKLKFIDNYSFGYGNEFTNLPVINHIVYADFIALYALDNLSSYSFKPNTKIIYNGCFELCENLESISIPDSIIFVGSGVFNVSDEHLEVEDNIVYADNCALYNTDENATEITFRQGTKFLSGFLHEILLL